VHFFFHRQMGSFDSTQGNKLLSAADGNVKLVFRQAHTLSNDFVSPIPQFGPNALSKTLISLDLNSHPIIQSTLRDSISTSHMIISGIFDMTFLLGQTTVTTDDEFDPTAIIAEPVNDRFGEPGSVMGFVLARIPPRSPWFCCRCPHHLRTWFL
jgi:hypothetical protein